MDIRKRNGEKRLSSPENWAVDGDEKRNLCDWLCENGTADDFQHFREIFNLLEEVGVSESTGKQAG